MTCQKIEKDDLAISSCLGGFATAIPFLFGALGVTFVITGYYGYQLNKVNLLRQNILEQAIFNPTVVDPSYLAQLDIQIARYTKLTMINAIAMCIIPWVAGIGAFVTCGGGMFGLGRAYNGCVQHYVGD